HAWYSALAQEELRAMEGSLEPLIVERIGPARARHFVDNWRQLVVVLERGELRPGHLKAAKPRE
ncbi:MAG: SAM-dependent methyltransferase, partial [Gammaproteobacteria bacterium]|nr:SAM-dependent methyltransferase [Gammaproteobacteria bacterium]